MTASGKASRAPWRWTLHCALSAIVVASAPARWTHPGVFVGSARLAFIAQQVRSNASSPMAAAFAQALASSYLSKAYTAQGPPATGVIECGSFSKPNLGCSAEDSDGTAAFAQLVAFSVSGDAVYAANAVKILDAYGRNLKAYTNSNAPLQASWGLEKWCRAAELAMHLPGVNWPAGDAQAFVAMLRRVALPLVVNGLSENGNWELSAIDGMLGLAVLEENATLFDRAAGFFTQRVAAYYFNHKLDGGAPRPAPRGSPSWYGQTVFSAATSGVAQETCRDEGHTTYSVAATSNAAETAALQGLDLWAQNAQRLATSLDFNAALLLPGAASPPDLCGGRKVVVAIDPSYEVAYDALARQRGFAMPNVLKHLAALRECVGDRCADPHMMVFEALTHAGGPPVR